MEKKKEDFYVHYRCLKCDFLLDIPLCDLDSYTSTDQGAKFYIIPTLHCGKCFTLCDGSIMRGADV